MTTQIALLNMYGIAIASDTLASLKTPNGFKHSYGNSKIWTPPAPHNFVVYHSGTVTFNAMPHQLHVETWFKTLTKPLATLHDYAESYKRYATSKQAPHHPDSEGSFLTHMFLDMVGIMRRHVDEVTIPEANDDWNAALLTEATEALEYYSGIPNFKGTSLTWADETIKLHKFNLKKQLQEVFPEGYPPKFQTLVGKCFRKFIITTVTTEADTTLTFAGFGEKELYPAVRKIDFRGVINGKLLAEPNLNLNIESTVKVTGIVYGAQTDAIWGLVQGFRSPVKNHLNNILGNHLPYAEDKQAKIDQVIEDLYKVTSDDYVNPFFRRLSSSSIPELAETAKDMINLQLLSAKLASYQETVGGEVEVLTIDKTNGIRWQNRI